MFSFENSHTTWLVQITCINKCYIRYINMYDIKAPYAVYVVLSGYLPNCEPYRKCMLSRSDIKFDTYSHTPSVRTFFPLLYNHSFFSFSSSSPDTVWLNPAAFRCFSLICVTLPWFPTHPPIPSFFDIPSIWPQRPFNIISIKSLLQL